MSLGAVKVKQRGVQPANLFVAEEVAHHLIFPKMLWTSDKTLDVALYAIVSYIVGHLLNCLGLPSFWMVFTVAWILSTGTCLYLASLEVSFLVVNWYWLQSTMVFYQYYKQNVCVLLFLWFKLKAGTKFLKDEKMVHQGIQLMPDKIFINIKPISCQIYLSPDIPG